MNINLNVHNIAYKMRFGIAIQIADYFWVKVIK